MQSMTKIVPVQGDMAQNTAGAYRSTGDVEVISQGSVVAQTMLGWLTVISFSCKFPIV